MKRARIILLVSLGIAVLGGVVPLLAMWRAGEFAGDKLKGGGWLALVIVPVALIIVVLSLLPFRRIFFGMQIKNAVTAPGKVLRVWDTGVSINDNPQVGMEIEVRPPSGAVFQVEGKTVVSRLNAALVQPGVGVEVKYDPLNTKRLEVVSIDLSAEPGGTIESRLEALERLREKGLVSAAEYQSKREEILKEL